MRKNSFNLTPNKILKIKKRKKILEKKTIKFIENYFNKRNNYIIANYSVNIKDVVVLHKTRYFL